MDSAGQSQAVTVFKLKGASNYEDWVFQAQCTLRLRGYIHAILFNPRDVLPDEVTGPEADLQSVVERKIPTVDESLTAYAILVSMVDRSCFQHVKHKRFAKDAWESLKAQFAGGGLSSNHLLVQRFLRLRCEGEGYDAVDRFLNEGVALAADLHAVNFPLVDGFVLHWLLDGLPKEFETFYSNVIQMLRKDPTAYNVESLCANVRDESRRLTAAALRAEKVLLLHRRPNAVQSGRVKKPMTRKAPRNQ